MDRTTYHTSVAINMLASIYFSVLAAAHLVHILNKINVMNRIITHTLLYNDYELTITKGHHKYKHGRKSTHKIG